MPAGANLGTIASLSLRDAGNEPTTFQVWGTVLTAGNYVAQQALWVTLVDAAMALVLGAKARTMYGNETNFVWAQPTNGAAREVALGIDYRDATTGKLFTAKLGTLDPTIPDYVVNVNARDVIEIGTPASVAAFVSAFNAFAVNPFTANACSVIGLRVSRGSK